MFQGKKTDQYDQNVDALVDSLVTGERGRVVYEGISLHQKIGLSSIL